ncbi:putative dsRNA-binding protein [[Phormidium] sp. LEGE 05292]|nr:putative dsRNA-binding protein [Phormidium sp. LEGE 05292]
MIGKYFTIKEDEPAHAKEFTVPVYVNGKVYGKGTDRSFPRC